MVEESLDDNLRTSFQNAQSGIRSLVYNVVEQVVLDMQRKDAIGETVYIQIAKFFDSDAAAGGC